MTTVTLVGPHLTPENHQAVLDALRHKSKHDVERFVAGFRPLPDVRPSVRRLPERRPAPPPAPTALSLPESEAQPKVPATSPAVYLPPPPTPAVVRPTAPERYKVQFTVSRSTYDKLRRAQDLLRHSMPNGDEAAVWRRDGGRCAFVGVQGRCAETGRLEFHHRVPYADGGGGTVDNIELRCRAHNVHEAERWFGPMLARESSAAS